MRAFAIINIHEAKLLQPITSHVDCYATHKARLRVCYVRKNYHTPRLFFIYFVLFHVRCADGINELSAEPCHPSQRYRVTAAPPVCSTEHTCGPTLQTDHIRDTAVEHFLLRVPQRGTVFLSNSETRQSAMPASDGI